MSWINKLQNRWNLKSGKQVFVVLFVFACTGTTVLLLKRPLVEYFSTDGETSTAFTIVYYLLILPIYNIILLCYGFIFGQLEFFWEYEKRTYRRITGQKNASKAQSGD